MREGAQPGQPQTEAAFLTPFTDEQTEAQGGGLQKDEVMIRSLEL